MAKVRITNKSFAVKATKKKLVFGGQYNPHAPTAQAKNPLRTQIRQMEDMIRGRSEGLALATKRHGENSRPAMELRISLFRLMATYSEAKWKLAEESRARNQRLLASKNSYTQEEKRRAKKALKALETNLALFEDHFGAFSKKADELFRQLAKRKGFKH